MKKIILLSSLILLASCSQPKLDPNYVKIDFKNLSINEFLEEVSEITGKEIIVEEEIKGKINFVSNGLILKSDLIPLANAILETKELTLVNRGDYYGIVKGSRAIFCGVEDVFPKRGIPKTDTIALDNLDEKVVQSKIKPLLHKSAKVSYKKESHTLVITAYPQSLKSIQMLIDKLKERKMLDLKHVK